MKLELVFPPVPEAGKITKDEILKRREGVKVMPLAVFSPAGQAKYVASSTFQKKKKKNVCLF